MNLRIKILSGILGLAMLLPCTGVRAEDEFSAEVNTMIQKIEKSVGAMSISTECAWNMYVELTKAFYKYRFCAPKLQIIRNVLLKLEQNVKKMPIIDLNLMQAICALSNFYDAYLEQWNTKHNLALEKWKKAYEMYSSLSSTMKDTEYSNTFNMMLDDCRHCIYVCKLKLTSPSTYYRRFFDGAVNRLEKMYEIPLKERSERQMNFIDNMQKEIFYELAEPLRKFNTYGKKSSVGEFITRINQCAMSMEEYMSIFDKGDKLLEFVNVIEKYIDYSIKVGDNCKKHEKYSEAMKAYFGARVILDCAIQIRNQEDYYLLVDSAIKCRIEKCERCMERLGEGTLF